MSKLLDLLDKLPSTETMQHPEKYIPKILLGAAKGLSTDLIGAPVDLIATGLKGIGIDSGPKPIGGSHWLKSAFGIDTSGESDPAELAGNLASGIVNPAHLAATIAATSSKMVAATKALSGIKAASGMGIAAGGMIVDAKKVLSPENVALARELTDFGFTKDQVFKATGAYEGPIDKKMKAVLSDANATLNTGALAVTASGAKSIPLTLGSSNLKLPDILDHPELYSMHPELKTTDIVPIWGQSKGGSYSSNTNTIGIGSHTNMDEMLSTILHETQHAIQNESGFAKGGNSALFLPTNFSTTKAETRAAIANSADALEAKYPEFSATATSSSNESKILGLENDIDYQEFKSLISKHNQLTEQASEASAKYKNIAGEAEARITQFMKAHQETSNPIEAYKAAGIDIDNLIPSPLDTMMDAISGSKH